jgi:hypothetical protein
VIRRRIMSTVPSLALLVCVSVAAPAGAEELAPKDASQLVTLRTTVVGGCQTGGTKFTLRVLPDGTTTPFTIPEGKVLVLTNFNWTVLSTQPITVSLVLESAPSFPVVESSQVFTTRAIPDIGGRSVDSAAIQQVVVRSGVLCLEPSGPLNDALVHGFFAPDR